MRRLITLSVCLAGTAWAIFFISCTSHQNVWGQEEERAARQEIADDQFDVEAVERRLDEIERLIDQAEAGNDDGRVRELRREGERLLDELEEFKRSQLDEDEHGLVRDEENDQLERTLRRLEVHRMELEMERLRLEIESARQEAAARLAGLATDTYALKAFVLTQLVHEHEQPGESAEFLSDLLQETDDPVIRRLIRVRLVALYRDIDQTEQARQQLRQLILDD